MHAWSELTCTMSLNGRMPHSHIGPPAGTIQMHGGYICRVSVRAGLNPTFASEFERRYRIPRTVNERVQDSPLEMADEYFTERASCCGTVSVSTDQKMTIALQDETGPPQSPATAPTYSLATGCTYALAFCRGPCGRSLLVGTRRNTCVAPNCLEVSEQLASHMTLLSGFVP
jgi:hypothetical protein